MSDIMQPVIEAEKQLADLKSRTIESLLKQREAIDEKLKRLGHGKRGRPKQN